jgi:hypothetical protein
MKVPYRIKGVSGLKMILVYTDFDDIDRVLSSYAEALLQRPGVQFLRILKPPDSISTSIEQELEHFLFSHTRYPAALK